MRNEGALRNSGAVEGVADADTTRDGGAVNPTEEIVRDGGAVEGVTQMIINVYLHLYNYKVQNLIIIIL